MTKTAKVKVAEFQLVQKHIVLKALTPSRVFGDQQLDPKTLLIL